MKIKDDKGRVHLKKKSCEFSQLGGLGQDAIMQMRQKASESLTDNLLID